MGSKIKFTNSEPGLMRKDQVGPWATQDPRQNESELNRRNHQQLTFTEQLLDKLEKETNKYALHKTGIDW